MYGEESNNITPDQIKKLAEEMRRINKKIDLKNPLISEMGENIVSQILEGADKKTTSIKERQLDVNEINRKKNLGHINEAEKEKWNRMLKYDIPDDEKRDV